MKLLKTKISLSFICLNIIFLLSGLNVSAFSSTEENKNPSYYFLSLTYDSEANSVSLNPDGFAVDVTDINLTNDTGNGSQFYAKVIDGNAKPIQFKNGTDKFFLGQWKMVKFTEGYRNPVSKKMTGGGPVAIKKGGIQTTVPYFPDGQKIEVYDAKTDKLVLSVDVSKFSRVATIANQAGNTSNTASSDQLAANNQAAVQETEKKVSLLDLGWWGIAILIVLLAGGGIGYYVYVRNRDSAQ